MSKFEKPQLIILVLFYHSFKKNSAQKIQKTQLSLKPSSRTHFK